MTNEIFEKFTAQVQTVLAPVQELNKLYFYNVEKLVEIQLNSARDYAEICLDQFRSVSEINDQKGLEAFISKQGETFKHIGEKVIADSQAVANIGTEFSTEAQKIAEKSVEAAAAAVNVAPVAKKAPAAKKAA
ncbi:MAG: phasin family protein [Sedimenticola sp.]|nr:phasin family protein [Sedimenticola sp.]MCW8947560.1 phasin family protein [Sedimenticola sp.]MCW8950063.1 phasin family protein [Sedimenticola sp.]MCW8976653.1 phasin family protein [Sedimenticola sp.]